MVTLVCVWEVGKPVTLFMSTWGGGSTRHGGPGPVGAVSQGTNI